MNGASPQRSPPALANGERLCYTACMSYRTVEIAWKPRKPSEWHPFTASRQEAARLWGDLVVRHHRLRCLNWKWPSKGRWEQWAKRKYPGISAQSCQQIIGEFCEAVHSTRQLRKNGHAEASFPWKKPRYRDVVYTNQDARLHDGHLILPHGNSGTLRIRIPSTITLPGRLMEVRLSFGRVRLVCEVPDEPHPEQTVIGVDLGVNTLIAATDGQKAVLVSGRHVKAIVQWRNKCLEGLQKKQVPLVKGSRRWKRLQRRKHAMLDRTQRQIRDACHQATHMVKEAFPGATCYVGEPYNEAAQTTRRKQAQQISQACTRKIIGQLDYKTAGAITVNEAYSSQTCPVCGERSKHKRIYLCPRCGTKGPRDAVGAVNIRSIGAHGAMLPGCAIPAQITYRRLYRRRSGGHPARSSGN